MSERQIPVLNEHQARGDLATASTGYMPTPEEKKAIKLAQKIFEKAKAHRKKFDEHWLDRYRMFRGKQWKEQRPSYRHSEVINFIFQAIQSVVPVMTDARQRFDFLPQEPSDIEIAKILSEVAEADWERGNWSLRLAEIIYEDHFYGTGMCGVPWNPKLRDGAGAIDLEVSDLFYCFPDPNAKDVNVKARSFCYAEPVDVEILKQDYPDKKEFIKADLSDLMQGDKTDLDQVRFKSPTDNKTIIEGQSSGEAGNKDQALKITVYLHCEDYEEEEKKIAKEDGTEESVFEQRKKYPNGRKIVIASGVLCEDGPSPYEDGLFPYARLINYIDPNSFWGISEIEQLESPQKIFNKLISFSLDVLTLMGNPIWLVPNGSGVDTDNLFNRPGLIVEYDGEKAPARQEGVQLQPYVLQLIDRLQTWFQDMSGRTDITQGVTPSGVTAASAIAQLQEAAQTRIRLKSRNLDAFLQNVGQLYKNRVFQFRTAPEIVRLTGNDNAQKYFKFHIEHVPNEDGSTTKIARVRNFQQMPDGSYAEDLEAKEYIINGDFDVRVSTGSALPFAKTQKTDLAFKLMEAGAIDAPELLAAVEYPNHEAVWQAVQERQAQKAQAEAQAANDQAMAEAQAKAQPQAPPPAA